MSAEAGASIVWRVERLGGHVEQAWLVEGDDGLLAGLRRSRKPG